MMFLPFIQSKVANVDLPKVSTRKIKNVLTCDAVPCATFIRLHICLPTQR